MTSVIEGVLRDRMDQIAHQGYRVKGIIVTNSTVPGEMVLDIPKAEIWMNPVDWDAMVEDFKLAREAASASRFVPLESVTEVQARHQRMLALLRDNPDHTGYHYMGIPVYDKRIKAIPEPRYRTVWDYWPHVTKLKRSRTAGETP